MTIDRMRGILFDMLLAASYRLRRTREAGNHEAAAWIQVERDQLVRLLAIIDGD